jgi:hypothetical protein
MSLTKMPGAPRKKLAGQVVLSKKKRKEKLS